MKRAQSGYRICAMVWAVTLLMFAGLAVSLLSAAPSDSLFPLVPKMEWEYQVAYSTMFENTTGKLRIENLTQRGLEEKKVTPQQVNSGEGRQYLRFLVQDEKGIYEYARQRPIDIDPVILPKPRYLIQFPLKVGTRWTALIKPSLLQFVENTVSMTFVIDKTDDIVIVPAGTYEGCVRIKGVGSTMENLGIPFGTAHITLEHYVWLAPGVGMIKEIIKENSNHRMVGDGQMSVQLETVKKQ